MTDLNVLAKEINDTAREKGFWDKERNLGEMLMLVISELAEGLEEDREGRPLVWYRHFDGETLDGKVPPCTCTPKPEGLVVELADAVIRMLDTLYARTAGLDLNLKMETTIRQMEASIEMGAPDQFYRRGGNVGDYLCMICAEVSMSRHMWPGLVKAIIMCESMAQVMMVDIWSVAREKMEYNNSRPRMHGKAY